MPLLHDDIRSLYASMSKIDAQMFHSVWANWLAAEMASGECNYQTKPHFNHLTPRS
jgi:hypothetical protein